MGQGPQILGLPMCVHCTGTRNNDQIVHGINLNVSNTFTWFIINVICLQ